MLLLLIVSTDNIAYKYSRRGGYIRQDRLNPFHKIHLTRMNQSTYSTFAPPSAPGSMCTVTHPSGPATAYHPHTGGTQASPPPHRDITLSLYRVRDTVFNNWRDYNLAPTTAAEVTERFLDGLVRSSMHVSDSVVTQGDKVLMIPERCLKLYVEGHFADQRTGDDVLSKICSTVPDTTMQQGTYGMPQSLSTEGTVRICDRSHPGPPPYTATVMSQAPPPPPMTQLISMPPAHRAVTPIVVPPPPQTDACITTASMVPSAPTGPHTINNSDLSLWKPNTLPSSNHEQADKVVADVFADFMSRYTSTANTVRASEERLWHLEKTTASVFDKFHERISALERERIRQSTTGPYTGPPTSFNGTQHAGPALTTVY